MVEEINDTADEDDPDDDGDVEDDAVLYIVEGQQLESDDEETPVRIDADPILFQLDELEQNITGDSRPLAKAAFQRVFESITLCWEKVSSRRRELVRAEVIPRFPFCLTGNTLSQSVYCHNDGRSWHPSQYRSSARGGRHVVATSDCGLVSGQSGMSAMLQSAGWPR